MKGVLWTLSEEKAKCVAVSTGRNYIWRCLNSMFGEDDKARLILDLSLTSFIVVTDIVPAHPRRFCKIVNVIQSKECVEFLHQHRMSSESHRHLLNLSKLSPVDGTCISLHHRYGAKVKCTRCIRYIFDISENYYTTPYSTFLDAPEFSVEKTLGLLDKILKCHNRKICLKIQMVPHSFCSEHRAFVKMTPSKPQTQMETSTIHILSEHTIPVGLWPPSSKQTTVDLDTMPFPSLHMAPISSKSRTPIWPLFITIAFVEFQSAKSQQLKCAICLVQHSEVFFVHVAEDEVSGYVWMRQAPSHILRLCLEKTCSILTYDEKRIQLKRPVGLRQWTAFDLKHSGGAKGSE